ncbi:unnamed protein product [Rotaria sp. Silwood1]|nr:unnamed protein product [Rotaria sp. Silwood1]
MAQQTTIQKMIKEFGGFKRINDDTRNFVKPKYKFHSCSNSTTSTTIQNQPLPPPVQNKPLPPPVQNQQQIQQGEKISTIT